ncbi:MAG: hypothetical protein Q4C44_02130 [bacterium]|nr:hypothetical protein [bacterium]
MKDNKKLKIYISLFVVVLIIIGVSYAYFMLRKEQTNDNVIGTRTCLNTTLNEQTSRILLEDAIPISDNDGLNQTPFTFSVTNNCDSYVKLTITIENENRESTSTSLLNDNLIKINLSPKGTTTGTSKLLGILTLTDIEAERKGYIISETGLKGGETKEYDLRTWMDSNTTLDEGLGKSWEGKIVIIVDAEETPQALDLAILGKNNSNVTTPLTTPGLEISDYVLDDASTTTVSVDETYQNYYWTYGTDWKASGSDCILANSNVTSDIYANSYSSLINKYLSSWSPSSVSSETATVKPGSNTYGCVYYITNATKDSFSYKSLCSVKNQTEAVIASTEDDYGTSYYFRGAVKNNFIEYANMCWRIVRITGDGSIKLTLYNYNGLTDNNFTPASSTPCNVTGGDLAFARYEGDTIESKFNSTTDNAFAGLMYGNVGCSDKTSLTQNACTSNGGTWTNSSSYAEAHANINKSIILQNLEKWYDNVLSKQSNFNENQLADTIWCNDKSVVTDTAFNPDNMTNLTNLGYGRNQIYFGAVKRMLTKAGTPNGSGPSLICSNDNNGGKLSKFTVSDTTNGNGALDKKIGLLTADELAYAGTYASIKRSSGYYLNENSNGNHWFTATPYGYNRGVYNFGVLKGTRIFGEPTLSSNNREYGIRPAISLVSSTTITGKGTATNPYKVVE